MVLKIVWQKLVSPKEGELAMSIKTDRFFDGFDNVIVEDIQTKGVSKCALTITHQFTSPGYDDVVKQITLIGKEPRIIWVDKSYEAYLMSDIGKTIEKLN